MNRDDWGTFNYLLGGLVACLLAAAGFSVLTIVIGTIVGTVGRYLFTKSVLA